MKKLLLPVAFIGLIFSSCGGKDPQPPQTGSVKLDNENITMEFGQKNVLITPAFEGAAETKAFVWTSSNSEVVSVNTIPLGLKGELDAKRITSGEPVKITLQAKDGSMKADCNVTVKERSTILKNVRYPHGKNHTEIRQNAPQYYELETEADANPLIYKSTLLDNPETNITHYIYNFDNNGKVNSMYVLLKNEALANSAVKYLEERYSIYPAAGEGGIQFYDLSSDESQPANNTVAGVFTQGYGGYNQFGVKYKLK
jgi:hypothetical protein